MTRIYVGIDDTDNNTTAVMGTGRLVRLLGAKFAAPLSLHGVVRHQLLVDPRIPYTSHNSPACAVVDAPDATWVTQVADLARAHVLELASEGSDPGLCVATEDQVDERLVEFGIRCGREVVDQPAARAAVGDILLEGLGGTNDGIIGASAAVGLTHWGWAGRYIEFGELRAWPPEMTVGELRAAGIEVVSMDRNARPVAAGDMVDTAGKLRPRYLMGRPVLAVEPVALGLWRPLRRLGEAKHGKP